MALKFPKIFNLDTANARTRMFILVGGVAAVIVIIFLGVKFFGGPTKATGPSHVASAPSSLQSVPGGKLSPEYYRALQQANVQSAKQATISGSSAVPTLLNVPGQQTGNCTVLCPGEEAVDVSKDINDLLQQGKLSQDDANHLLDAVKNNASVDEYAAALNELVKAGKLTPDQARALLDKYKKQHSNGLLADSAKVMDGYIKSGQLSVDAANDLLTAQKNNLTPSQYADTLNRLVGEGKITPALAADLLAQYSQQRVGELNKQGEFRLQQMAKSGQITADVASALADLQKKNLSAKQYCDALQKFVADGKMTPATATKLCDEYQKRRALPTATLNEMLAKGGGAAACAQHLLDMRANNAAAGDYTNELKRCVQEGSITPEMAASLLQDYQALISTATAPGGPGIESNVPGASEFAKLQQRLQKVPTGPQPQAQGFVAAASESQAAANQARAQNIQNLSSVMTSQAQSLISAWQPLVMEHRAGKESKEEEERGKSSGRTREGSTTTTTTQTQSSLPSGPPIIKAGTILFAILETEVNSDYPDSPVMATIVSGDVRGAKLLGKLVVTKTQQSQTPDRVTLNFNLMNKDDWTQSKSVNAFAIDPETAKSALATSVNYHYLMRYGSIFASSFLQGYSQAITQSGATTTTSILGTTTTTAKLDPLQKIAVGLGQVGTSLSSIVAPWANTPPTIKVKAGVGLGILFMADVTQ